MIIELGHFAIILAFIFSLIQMVAGFSPTRFSVSAQNVAARAAIAVCGLCILSFASLIHAYATSDFSVVNVALNSHSLKPMLYKITGVWGNHEGSLILWVSILAIFGLFMARDRLTDPLLLQRALGVQGALCFAFISFILFTSNPFTRTDSPPFDGNDLNPVLQDPGLAFHPPTLYIGYVGFSAVFALAAAALIVGHVDGMWARRVRPYAIAAWTALTAGICLGSWWAYYELGWGGWWFWDPVENASLLPWLTGTALLHSLVVLEHRGALKRWTILLAILTFSLSMLGTFLVRSGVLTSVHSFATDPARGLYILALLVIFCGGALGLYAWRAHRLHTTKLFAPVSREGALVTNNLILVTMAATVCTGTLYPLLMDALVQPPVSVGPPYYNATVLPLAIPLCLLMAVSPFLPWKRPGKYNFMPAIILIACMTLIALVTAGWVSRWQDFASLGGLGLVVWLLFGSAYYAWSQRRALTLNKIAGTLGHAALGFVVLGVLGTFVWRVEDLRVVKPGDIYNVGRYTLRFDGVAPVYGPNYGAQQATISVMSGTLVQYTMHPQKRWYPVSDQQTTEADIRLNIRDDLYIVLGDRDTAYDPNAWVVRTYVHPFVSQLWLGFILLSVSGIVAFFATVRLRTRT